MEGFRTIFQGVGDPRESSAKKHGLIKMPAAALPATLPGSSSGGGLARCAERKQELLSEFMELKGGPPSRDSVSGLSDALDPEQLSTAMTKFANALHPAQAFEAGSGLVPGQTEVDGKSNGTAAIPGLPEETQIYPPSKFPRRRPATHRRTHLLLRVRL